MKNIIIIGGGISGTSAALAARRHYPACNITVFSNEPYPFYNRIGLVGLLTGALTQEQLPSFPADYLHNKRIDYRCGVTVSAIDTLTHQVTTTAGVFAYDKLILATGATPFVPPTPGLAQFGHTLWTIADARRLAKDLGRPEQNITIIGGGVLAIESALELAALGHKVAIIEKESRLMAAQLNTTAAGLLKTHLESQGLNIHLGSTVAAVTANGHQVELANGQKLASDLLLVQTGVRPNITLAQQAGLKCQRGIVVDQYMVTSNPDVLACGNCAEFNGQLALLWNPAQEQGELAGANALSPLASYQPGCPVLHLKNNFGLFSAGAWQQAQEVKEERTAGGYKARFYQDGRLSGVILVKDLTDYPKYLAELNGRPVDEDGHQLEFDGQRWVCKQCGYTYEGPLPPAVCPVCHVGRDQFIPA